jgi:hypothetical protein
LLLRFGKFSVFSGLGDFRGICKVQGSLGLFLGFGKVRAFLGLGFFWADFRVCGF